MCGIAGYVGTRRLERGDIQGCLDRMTRRGPDASGWLESELPGGRRACLLHTRLSIIDLDPRSNQPFRTGSSALVFNGEIYNYLELRRELTELGETLTTSSDTEALLLTLKRFGWAGLDKCEGMWAFASLDEAAGEVWLSRDRFGEKPLYLHQDATGVYFGSEPKLIFALLGRTLPVNREHLRRYMVNGYKSLYKTGQTFFEGLRELAPGALLRLGPDGAEEIRYWRPSLAQEPDMTYQEAVAEARRALMRAVEIRLRADVPLAFCLSGGVDSNALIGIAKRVFDYDVHGFTIMNTDQRYEERDMVELAVRELSLRHTAIPVSTAEFLPRLRELVRYHDSPVCTITYYVHWLLMKSVAEQGYRISLSGTGADELFSGYYDHHLAYLKEVRRLPDLYAQSLANWRRDISPIVRNPFLQDPEAFIKNPGLREHIYLEAEEFAGFLTEPFAEPFAEVAHVDDLLRNRMLNELFAESVPVILHEDDLNAMYYSIENRSPFLDRALFDCCRRIPTRHLVRDGMAKAVLRDAARGLAPDAILDNRRKVGFNAPILDLLDVRDPAVRAELLDDSPVFEVIRKDKIERLLDEAHLPNSRSKFLFYFLNSKIFLEEFAA